MRSFVRLTVLAAFACALATRVHAATGGPDNGGYTWRDGAEPGVAYAWEEISATGTDLALVADDANSGFLTMSFPFPYRGLTYTQVAACTNGWISLVDSGANAWDNLVCPTAGAPLGTIAPFWDDFKLDDPAAGGKMYSQDFGDHFVIEWADVPYFADLSKKATFEVILHANGVITAQIAATNGPRDSATIGIESVDDTDGLTAWFDASIPPPPYVVEFVPPVPIAVTLDCANARPIGCGDDVLEDLTNGAANQTDYRCVRGGYDGKEQVYLFESATPTTARIVFDAFGSDLHLVLLDSCNPNACRVPASNLIALNGFVGSFYIVVDCAAGDEAPYRLRVECLPLPTTLDCTTATPTACGVTVAGDLSAGTAMQDSYWCSLSDYSGREQVFTVDFPVQLASATFTLTTLSGNPDLIVLSPCDANACVAPPSDAVTIADPVGTYDVVVDCAPGDEGAYELTVSGGTTPSRSVGGTLRAVAHSTDTVTFDWSGAPSPLPSESYVVLRADGDPRGPFDAQVEQRARTWTDPAAPATFPLHAWFYDVRITDSCGNLSGD